MGNTIVTPNATMSVLRYFHDFFLRMRSKSLYSPKVTSRPQRATLKMSNPHDERSSWKGLTDRLRCRSPNRGLLLVMGAIRAS